MNLLAQTEAETTKVWPGQVPDADLWRDIGRACPPMAGSIASGNGSRQKDSSQGRRL